MNVKAKYEKGKIFVTGELTIEKAATTWKPKYGIIVK